METCRAQDSSLCRVFSWFHVGGCQNYGPFLGTLHIRCRTRIGTQEGTIILTTTHVLEGVMSKSLPFYMGTYVYIILWDLEGPTQLIRQPAPFARALPPLNPNPWTPNHCRCKPPTQMPKIIQRPQPLNGGFPKLAVPLWGSQ